MPRILIADDEPQLRDVMAELCRSLGAETVTASDGLDALERLHQDKFDVVLLDLTMPRLGGLGVLERLRDQPPEPRPAVIVVTAAHDNTSRMQATSLGAIDFVDKPFRVPNLSQRLARVLQIIELERRLAAAETTLDSMRRIDPVTGCGAFAELYQALEAEFYVASQRGSSLACVVISDERYDAVLAALGRDAGDKRLVALRQEIEKGLAPLRRIFRVDAAEFVVLMPESAEEARQKAQACCAKLDGDVQPGDVAVAIAGFPHPEIPQASALYRAANVSLAQARSHRRVVTFEGF
jgi:PleD family two-component response regulator